MTTKFFKKVFAVGSALALLLVYPMTLNAAIKPELVSSPILMPQIEDYTESQANAINDHGVVVGHMRGGEQYWAVGTTWKYSTGFIDKFLPSNGGSESMVMDISKQYITGWSQDGSTVKGFVGLVDPQGNIGNGIYIPYEGSHFLPQAVNNSGEIVATGSMYNTAYYYSTLLGLIHLNPLVGTGYYNPIDINDSGIIVGNFYDGLTPVGVTVDIKTGKVDKMPGYFIRSINNNGDMLIYQFNDNIYTPIYAGVDGTMTVIHGIRNYTTSVMSMNESGWVVGTAYNVSGTQKAIAWHKSVGTIDLDKQYGSRKLALIRATDINESLSISGYAVVEDMLRAFVLHLDSQELELSY